MRPVVALVPAAGRGVRLGESTPKAFVPVGGTPMVRLAVDGLIASGAVHRVVVVVPADLVDAASALLSTTSLTGGSMPPVPVQVVVGGAERTDSVRAGIAAAPDAAFYLVHDAARALTPPELMAAGGAEAPAGRAARRPPRAVGETGGAGAPPGGGGGGGGAAPPPGGAAA
ncbi:2-C-methyl-D-erythritol 4-phosphate cytidylyltransferase, partial [Nocardia sp. NPDC058497]|uniref:2-C-methyl-D-erythritol 4-phosphate cytidylyltransferase n=1 Tax=Nocardia sp. NPDC058497 TaxID=3346529 RepID=UPI00364F7982